MWKMHLNNKYFVGLTNSQLVFHGSFAVSLEMRRQKQSADAINQWIRIVWHYEMSNFCQAGWQSRKMHWKMERKTKMKNCNQRRNATRCSAALTQSRDTRVERGQKAGPSGEKQSARDQGTRGRGRGVTSTDWRKTNNPTNELKCRVHVERHSHPSP